MRWSSIELTYLIGHRLSCYMVCIISFLDSTEPTHANYRCGPCHAIAPAFEALSKRYANVNFLKCDVDAARDVAGRYTVSAM